MTRFWKGGNNTHLSNQDRRQINYTGGPSQVGVEYLDKRGGLRGKE